MQTQPAGLDKHSKVIARASLFILGILILLGLILLPTFASSAQIIEQLGIKQYFPIVFKEYYVAPLFTPTPTYTSTPTPPFTPAKTSTASPTVTGTQATKTLTPTPTRTGTITVAPSLKISVSPTQAKVNESFTFTIEAGNNGSGPTHNNLVLDSFPTYIDVITVTSTRGSITKLTHSFVVTIGDINPGEKITITAVVKVNSTLTRTETQTNAVTMTYEVSKSATANGNY